MDISDLHCVTEKYREILKLYSSDLIERKRGYKNFKILKDEYFKFLKSTLNNCKYYTYWSKNVKWNSIWIRNKPILYLTYLLLRTVYFRVSLVEKYQYIF